MRSIITISALTLSAIPSLLLVLLASFIRLFKKKEIEKSGRTILLTGGKMTKCLQLARLFHAQGDRVVVAETPLYRWCGTRFSNAVDRFVIIPKIKGDGKAYCDALVDLAKKEKADYFIPVASPKAAVFDAIAKPDFPAHTRVIHFDEEVVKNLDDKFKFSAMCESYGLSVPEAHRIESREALLNMDFNSDKKYILKKIDYDPVHRLDLRTLPHPGWEERVAALPISKDDPWILQEYVEGDEICTHTTAINGQTKMYVCCPSSPFQVNYVMLHLQKVRAWVDHFVSSLGKTGQISFDFIINQRGEVMPIECNPRTHSAIVLFHNQPQSAQAYYPDQPGQNIYLPDQKSGHVYWIFHELDRLLKARSFDRVQFLIKRILTGREAIFDWSDPWPFWFNNHVSIPYQLWHWLKQGKHWTHIDFNIGKIAVPGGD